MSDNQPATATMDMQSPAETAMDGDSFRLDDGEFCPQPLVDLRESNVQGADWNKRADFWGGMWHLLIGAKMLRPTSPNPGTNAQEL